MSINYTIVGLYNCPWFAKGCIMARLLSEQDPTLQFTIEMKNNIAEWEDFCTSMQETQGWTHLNSPVIYETLLLKPNAKANLIGSIDDFCEYVNLVFCFCCHISTCEIQQQVCTNIKAIEDLEETLSHQGFVISIVDPDLKTLELLLPQLCKIYSSGNKDIEAKQLIIRVCTFASNFKDLQALALEVQDMVLTNLRFFHPCRRLGDCLKDANVLLLMQDFFEVPAKKLVEMAPKADFDQKLHDLAKAITEVVQGDCFLLVAPNSCMWGCAVAGELRRLIPCSKVPNGALVALGHHAVTKAKAEIALRAHLPSPGAIKRLQVWGWPGLSGVWVHTLGAMVEDRSGPIRGPFPVLRPFEHMTSEAWWVYNEFGREFLEKQRTQHLKKRTSEDPQEGPKFYSRMCIADAIVRTLQAWFTSVHPVESSCKNGSTSAQGDGCHPSVLQDVRKVALPVLSVGVPYRGADNNQETLIPQGTFVVQPSVCYNGRWWPIRKTSFLSQQAISKELGKLWRESMSHSIYNSGLEDVVENVGDHRIPLSPAEESPRNGGEGEEDDYSEGATQEAHDGSFGPQGIKYQFQINQEEQGEI